MNADPVILVIIIEHLQTISVFVLISINASGRLSNLPSGEQSLLNFVKARHVLNMLHKPVLQNKLLKIYRKYYLKCLKLRRHQRQPSDLEPIDPEPFVYLRTNVGNYSKAEKFWVDFHAGLMQHQRELRRSDFRLLPREIGDLVRDRWIQLSGRARKDSHQADFEHDRIATRDPCYKVTENEAVEHSVFQIQYLYDASGGTYGLIPPLPDSPPVERLKRSQTTQSSASATRSSSRRSATSVQDLPPPSLENPFDWSTSKRAGR